MFRFFVILAAIWRFGLDDIVLSAFNKPTATMWRRLTAWRHQQSGAVRLRLAFEHLGPIFIKFGQLLSTRRDILHADYADELAKLQDRVPPETEETIQTTLQNAYRQPLRDIFSEFDTAPVGSASVAQVHRARLCENGNEVAVKILRPGIEARIRKDLRLLRAFAALAQLSLKDARRLKPRAVVEQFALHLQEEVNLLREAANCAKIGRNFSNSELLRVPSVCWKWCNKQVMVMDFLSGVPISRVDEFNNAVNKSALARAGIGLFFTQVFRDNFFHADMHPGNLHVDAAGRFILLDYGIVGQLTDFDKEYLLRNFLAFFDRDYRRVAEMHVEAGWTPSDTDINAFESEIRTVCEPIFAQPLKNISFGNFLLNMFQTARKFNLEVQPQLLLLQKTLLNVESIGRELDPDINMWDTAKPVLEKWSARQYRPREIISLLRRQAPDWMALLSDAPSLLREISRQKRDIGSQTTALRKQLQFWRTATMTIMIVIIASALWWWAER